MSITQRLLSTTTKLSQSIYFGENSLNRLSFLRKNPIFIANALTSPYSKIIFFHNLNPLVDQDNKLYTSSYSQLGPKFSTCLDQWINFNRDQVSQSQQTPLLPLCHFLGLSTLNYSPFKFDQYSGEPYFALEISQTPEIAKLLPPNLRQLTNRQEIIENLNNHEASIFAQAKMYLEWLSSTKYCRGCGSPTIPINAGSELLCSSNTGDQCQVKSAPVSNASFPRLDPVLITCVVHGDYVLFTRNAQFPRGMYSCIAGFIEPGESIENAVKREVWEESGLRVEDVKIVKSQPWPFPTNMMIGCIAFVPNGDEDAMAMYLNHDDELQDARWIHKEKLYELIYNGEENNFLTIMIPEFPYGIPNEKTLAHQLYKFATDEILFSS